MKRVDELKDAYQSILANHTGPTRKLLLQSIKQQLKELVFSSKKEEISNNKAKLQITQTNDTNNSQISYLSNCYSNDLFASNDILSRSITGNDEICQIQARILEKQRLKFGVNQEIQELEEEYLGLQETIFGKKERVERLEKLIAWKSYEISKTSSQDTQQPEAETSFAKKIMCFFLF